jgi:hypothetical protein
MGNYYPDNVLERIRDGVRDCADRPHSREMAHRIT